MFITEIIPVCCENHTKHTNILCGHDTEFYYTEAGGKYRTSELEEVKFYLNFN
jgi:hypothetical protein